MQFTGGMPTLRQAELERDAAPERLGSALRAIEASRASASAYDIRLDRRTARVAVIRALWVSSEGANMWGNETERRAFGEIWPLWHGGSEVRDRRRAVQRLRPLADQGHAPAQFALGWACFDGDGVRRDHATSFEYCLAAAEQGYPAAEGMVGSYYAMARPKHGACPLEAAQAVRWNRRAAGHGNSGAQYSTTWPRLIGPAAGSTATRWGPMSGQALRASARPS